MSDGKKQQILVTGGAGFVGANLTRQLLEAGYWIRVLDNLSAGELVYLDGLDIDLVEGDILDAGLVEKLVGEADGIVHLAAQTGVPGSVEDPRRDCEINVIGTLNLLEAARLCKVKGRDIRFVFASSNAPLGRQDPPATEDKVPLPISPYGASKLAGEGYCLAYHGSWGVETVVFRFANLYGPYAAHKESVMAKFAREMLSEGTITIDGDGTQTRDFIFVGDMCRAIQLALEASVCGEVFQIATGVETSIVELATRMQALVGNDVAVQYGPVRRGDIKRNYSGISKVERVLGWKPEVNLNSGLEKTIAWFRDWGQERVAQDDFVFGEASETTAENPEDPGYGKLSRQGGRKR